MIVRLEKCPKCNSQVAIVLPDLFPNIDAKKLEKFKTLSLAKTEEYCKQCKQGGHK